MGSNDGKTGVGATGAQTPAQQQEAAAEANLKTLQLQMQTQQLSQQANKAKGPGYESVMPDAQEQQAGVTPPGYQSTIDQSTGQLLDQYKLDPYSGAAEQQLRAAATSTGPTALAQAQLQAQQADEVNQRGAAGLQSQQANDSAMAQLSRLGGLSGGARTSLARSSSRDALNAQQGVSQAGATARYGINAQDAQYKQGIVSNEANAEGAAATQNIATAQTGLTNQATFDSNRYNQQMQAWAAGQSADATRAAGGGGKK